MHRKYRALQQECRLQAALTGHGETREALKEMEREYKVLADWLERRLLPEDQAAPKGADAAADLYRDNFCSPVRDNGSTLLRASIGGHIDKKD